MNYRTYTTTLQYTPKKKCISIVLNIFRDNCNTLEELKTKAMQFFLGGEGQPQVYHGRCANGE